MSILKLQMPKLGESIHEVTITKWFVKEGEKIREEDTLFEVATDKVDSEIPSPVNGIIKSILFKENDIVSVGEVVAIIEKDSTGKDEEVKPVTLPAAKTEPKKRFYSPLVMNIAKHENVTLEELETITGSGEKGRVQKKDILEHIAKRRHNIKASTSIGSGDIIIEMDRVRKLISEHMIHSKHTAPHVTSVVEADVTNMVLWRNKVKNEFFEKYNEKLTFTPLFVEATALALSEYPYLNASIDKDKIILRKKINIGIAVARPDGNLVIPVIHDANEKNLNGLARGINKLANEARNNKSHPDDYQGGTFTITNLGSFRNIIGTPIINQPQVAILATGSIEKKPSVMETITGDVIVVRHKMYLSLSYDHRIIDGAMGGAFLRRIADIIEEFNIDRVI